MVKTFSVNLTESACGHIKAFKRYDRNRILDAINEQLTHKPNEQTRNKKILRENPISDWELRVPPFRVFYEVDESEHVVRIVAVGVKQHNKLSIGGEEMEI